MDNADIEKLKIEVPAWQVIGERLKLRRQGREWVGLCPFHEERTPSFKVYRNGGGQWLWKCFGCDASGNIFQFLQRTEGLTFQQAVERVAGIVGRTLGNEPEPPGIGARELDAAIVDRTFRPALAEAKQFKTLSLARWTPYERALVASAEAVAWLDRERGIGIETAQRLHLGLFSDLRGVWPGHTHAGEVWLGLPAVRGEQVVSVKLRRLREKEFARLPQMETALFNEEAIDPLDDLLLLEGEFDALVLEQAGFPAVSVPSAGFTLTPEMRDKLAQAGALYLAGDTDPTGAEYMERLWRELGGTTYLLKWPDGAKDANEFFLTQCERDIEKFRAAVERLKQEARQRPMPSFYSMSEYLLAERGVNPLDDPNRLRFPWASVDRMAVILPTNVVSLFATQTGTGKTTWAAGALVEEAQRGQVVVVYSAELSPQEYSALVASYLTMQDRLHLTPDDFREAARRLGDARFYVGYNPDLNTIAQVLDLLEGAIRRLGATRVVLDGFHFLCRNSADQVREQENAIQRIKNLAVKYRVIFMVIGQPRKPSQQAHGRPPDPSDALGSRAFTDDAHATFHLHRAKRNDADSHTSRWQSMEDTTEVRLLKGRSMGEGDGFAHLYFRGDICRFFESTGAEPHGGGDYKERQAGHESEG